MNEALVVVLAGVYVGACLLLGAFWHKLYAERRRRLAAEQKVAAYERVDAFADPRLTITLRDMGELEGIIRTEARAEVGRSLKERDAEIAQRFDDERALRVMDAEVVIAKRLGELKESVRQTVIDQMADEVRAYRLASVDQANHAARQTVDTEIRRKAAELLDVFGLKQSPRPGEN